MAKFYTRIRILLTKTFYLKALSFVMRWLSPLSPNEQSAKMIAIHPQNDNIEVVDYLSHVARSDDCILKGL